MNKAMLLGRLTREPELRATTSGTNVCSFTVACQRRFAKDGQAQADFINCIAFGKIAEFISKYFLKGQRIALTGRIQTRSYDDKDGNKKYVTEIVTEEVEFAQSKHEADNTTLPPRLQEEGFTEVDESDLPF